MAEQKAKKRMSTQSNQSTDSVYNVETGLAVHPDVQKWQAVALSRSLSLSPLLYLLKLFEAHNRYIVRTHTTTIPPSCKTAGMPASSSVYPDVHCASVVTSSMALLLLPPCHLPRTVGLSQMAS